MTQTRHLLLISKTSDLQNIHSLTNYLLYNLNHDNFNECKFACRLWLFALIFLRTSDLKYTHKKD